MEQSNITLKSNIQPIDFRKKYDSDFLATIVDFAALNKLRFKIGGMNTNDYMFNPVQLGIVKNTSNCGFKKRDMCWGPIYEGNKIIMTNKCVNISCPNYSDHRLYFSNNECSQAEIDAFDPSVLPDENEYGYEAFLKKTSSINDVILNEKYDYGEAEAAVATHNDDVISLIYADPKAYEENITFAIPKSFSDITNLPSYTISTALNEKLDFDNFLLTTQEEVIQASPKDVLFVDAGPGTGKTYVLIQRINYLVTYKNVDPENILVLCFTNAAVDEIKNRLISFIKEGGDRGLANVDVRTFHSFAWWLIGQCNELFISDGWNKIDFSTLNYDTSLQMATKALCKFSQDIVGNWEHFIVDEVQDLTNNLARFVLSAVKACLKVECGMTILGDACQAIYDYTQDTEINPMKAEEFYCTLYNQIKDVARFCKFTHNHRQTNRLIETTEPLRKAILSNEHSDMESATQLLLDELPKIEKNSIQLTIEDFEEYRGNGKICLLLRNNGQTLWVSSNLRKRGIPHILNTNATERNFSTWIADAFSLHMKPYISFDEFQSAIAKNEILKFHSAEEIWTRLQLLLHSDDSELNVYKLLDAISFSKIEDPLLRSQKEGNILVSNIHRAKGHEYDSVIVDRGFCEKLNSEKTNKDEYKILYVAATRPKVRLITAPLSKRCDLSYITIYNTNRSRWGKVKQGQIVYLEFNDNIDHNINSFAFANQALFNELSIGDSVILNRVLKNGKITYVITHEDTGSQIGEIGDAFIEDMLHYMNISKDKYIYMPSTIGNLYISGIYTQIIDKEKLKLNPELAKVAPNGIWKWVELVGVGHANYDVY